MVDRVLITCKLMWEALPDHRAEFERNGLEMVVPDVPGQFLDEATMEALVPGVVGIIAGDDRIGRRVFAAADRLRVVSKWGVGIDGIDLAAAADHGVAVFNTPGVFADELADYALGFILMLARRQHEVDAGVRAGTWHKVRGVSLKGRVLGIVGLGSSGRALAVRATAIGMTVLGCDPDPPGTDWFAVAKVTESSLDDLLASSDVVSLHLPATPDTIGLIGRPAFRGMKRGAWLINTARGSLVDEAALIDALADGTVAAAALDVFAEEPLPVSHRLAEFPNVVLGSHNGSNTVEAVTRTNKLAVGNLLRGLGLVDK